MGGQLVFILRRLLLTVPMLFVMSVVVFLIIRLVPGDPVRTMLGFRATDENVAEVTRQLGLDRPFLEQYLSWVGGLFRGEPLQHRFFGNPLHEGREHCLVTGCVHDQSIGAFSPRAPCRQSRRKRVWIAGPGKGRQVGHDAGLE